MKPRIWEQFCRQSLLITLTAIAMTALATEPVMARHLPFIDKVQRDVGYGRIPLVFIPNQGQFDQRVAYAIQGKDKSIYFTSEGLTFVLTEQVQAPGVNEQRFLRDIDPGKPDRQVHRKSRAVKLDFVGAKKDVRPESLEQAETILSYFKGRPEEWKTGLRTSSKIIYRDLWPGIDLIYYGTVNRMKYDFIVHPGADPAQIRLSYRGADHVSVTREGRLEVSTPLGVFQDDVPVAWQEQGGKREGVSVAYALEKVPGAQTAAVSMNANDAADPPGLDSRHRGYLYGFTVGDYDRSRTLVLDPEMLVYCGFIGGGVNESGYAIAVDNSGNAYVTGYTDSSEFDFPKNVGPDLTYGNNGDAFVAKVSADGTTLVYCGYIGGSQADYGYGIAIDSSGNAYVTGYTYSDENSFPVNNGPDLEHNGNLDAFVAKVSADGTSLVYCGYIGGSQEDRGYGIAVDGSGNAYVTGYTYSNEYSFPVKDGPDTTYNGGFYSPDYPDAFVARVSANGESLDYCGYIGAAEDDHGYGIAVNSAGNAYVTGDTYRRSGAEDTFPVKIGPDLSRNGSSDAFVARVSANGESLDYCGYIGGSHIDYGRGIAVDSSGYAYVTGYTYSDHATFPVNIGPDLEHNGGIDAFVAKVNTGWTGLEYCGYIGGASDDYGMGIAVDSAGFAYITGNTSSSEVTFPVRGGPRTTHNGLDDAFVAKINTGWTGLEYCGYIGGKQTDYGFGIAVDGSGDAYVAGYTFTEWPETPLFPVTVGPYLAIKGNSDAFVAKIHCIGDLRIDIVGPTDGQWRRVGTDTWINGGTTETDIPPGSYTVEFKPVAGWTTPSPVDVVIACGQTTTETGTYIQQVGTVIIDPNPDSINAPWTLTGPYSYSQSGTGDQTLNNLPIGNYTIAWGDVAGWTEPGGATQAVSDGETTTFTGTYIQQVGTVIIDPTPDNAPWTLTGPGGYSQSGTGDLTINNLAPGDYTLTWEDLVGWTKPSPALSTQTLSAGGTITFTGTYTDAGISQIEITPSFLIFGYVPPGSYKDLILTVKNIGTGTLTGTASASPPFSIVSGGSYSLGANQTQSVIVRYTAPLEEGPETGSVTFTGGGGITVQAEGTNIKPRCLPWLLLFFDD